MNEQKTTASPEELAKFEAMADSWWDPNGVRPLHQFNPKRIEFIRDRARTQFSRSPNRHPAQRADASYIGCGGLGPNRWLVSDFLSLGLMVLKMFR